MNQRLIELYRQAVTFAYNTAGDDAGKGTIVESLTAGKFAELIVKECAELTLDYKNDQYYQGWLDYRDEIKQHFGVEE